MENRFGNIHCTKKKEKKKTSRIANAESSPLNSFVFSVVCVFNGHLSFRFDFFPVRQERLLRIEMPISRYH